MINSSYFRVHWLGKPRTIKLPHLLPEELVVSGLSIPAKPTFHSLMRLVRQLATLVLRSRKPCYLHVDTDGYAEIVLELTPRMYQEVYEDTAVVFNTSDNTQILVTGFDANGEPEAEWHDIQGLNKPTKVKG